jgi:hypothetical protein
MHPIFLGIWHLRGIKKAFNGINCIESEIMTCEGKIE